MNHHSCRRQGCRAWVVLAALGFAPDGMALDLPAPATATQARSVERLTYRACVERGLRRSLHVAAARTSLDLYEAKLREARTGPWPKLSFSGLVSPVPEAIAGTSGENPFTDYSWDLRTMKPLLAVELSLTQPIWTFGKLSALRGMAERGVDVAHAVTKMAEDELRYQVARAYWGLVLYEASKEMIADGQRLLVDQRERLAKLKETNDDGYNPSDEARLETYAAEVEDKVRGAERSRNLALGALRIALDQPDLALEVADTELQPPEFPLGEAAVYEALALANQPQLLALRGGVAAKLHHVNLYEANLFPDIAFVARLADARVIGRKTEEDSAAANPYNPAQSLAGLAVRWNLDFARTLAQRDQVRAEYRAIELKERAEHDVVRMDVRRLWGELRDLRAMVGVQERAMKAARGWLLAESQSWEDGFQEFAEVLRATEAWYRRRLAWLQAQYDLQVAIAALSRAVGADITAVAPAESSGRAVR